MDGRNIYALCDYNVPYEIGLKDAINKGMLVPFHYYGILDETVDYSKIRIVKGKYDEEELTKEFIKGRQYELIYKYYMKYRSKKGVGILLFTHTCGADGKGILPSQYSGGSCIQRFRRRVCC